MRTLLGVLAAILAGCASTWGPIAAARGSAGDLALTSGTLEITDRCTFLASGDRRMLLVWPAERTSWNPGTGVIRLTSLNGQTIDLRHGQQVALGGGGSSRAEDGLGADAWAASFDWVSRPAQECISDERWSITDVVLDRVVK
jgi:hypothetical protein